MAHGRVSVIAPVAGVVGIAVPVIADIGFIEMAEPADCAGIAMAIVAIILFSQSSTEEKDRAQTSFSIRFGFISGMGYGLADLFLGLMTTDTAEGGLAAARMTGASLAFSLLLVVWVRNSLRSPIAMAMVAWPGRNAWLPTWDAKLSLGLLLCALAGFLDCIGQLGYLSATQGQISVAAALVAMYPAISVGLAVWLLKERIGPTQWAGLAATWHRSAIAVAIISDRRADLKVDRDVDKRTGQPAHTYIGCGFAVKSYLGPKWTTSSTIV
jgi:uncharacterized membrane protein